MKNSKQFETNVFGETTEYARQAFWVGFKDGVATSDFKDLCASEKAEIDFEATKNHRTASGDDRVIFKKHVRKSKVLFILYIMGLWSPNEEKKSDTYAISDDDRVGV